MRRLLASWAALLGVVAFVCLPLSALAQRRGGVPPGLNWNRGGAGTTSPVLLSFMPVGGAGVVEGQKSMCPWLLAGGYLSGNYTCLDGNGTSLASSGMELSVVGSPTTDDRSACSNGPDCTARISQRMGAGNYFTTPAVSGPAGSFFVQALFNWDGLATSHIINRSNTDFMFRVTNLGAIQVAFGGTVAASANSAVTPGAWHHAAAIFIYSGAGAVNLGALYLDGAKMTQGSAFPPLAAAAAPFFFGQRSTASETFAGRLAGVSYSEAALTDAQVAAIAKAALGSITGTKGEAMTLTRATVSSCCRDDGTGCTVLPPGRACAANGRLKVRPVVANAAARSDELNLSPWAAGGATVTADAGLSPFGTMTADRVQAAAGINGPELTLAGAFASQTHVVSAFVRSATPGTPQAFRLKLSHQGVLDNFSTDLTATDTDQRFSFSVTFGATAGTGLIAGVKATTGAATDILVSGFQIQTNSSALLDYCPTGAAPASCALEKHENPTPPALSLAEGCARYCITPSWTGAGGPSSFLFSGASTSWGTAVTTSVRAIVGGVTAIVQADHVAGTQKCYRYEWSASAGTLVARNETSGLATTTAGFTGATSFAATVGNNTATLPTAYSISAITLGRTPGACTP